MPIKDTMKKTILSIFFLFCFCSSAFATSYTSSTSGDWNNVATWGGGGYPQAGDTAIISTGKTVTVPLATALTVGMADTIGTNAVSLQGTASLIIYGTLTSNGDINSARGTTIDIKPGGTLNLQSKTSGVYYDMTGGTGSGNRIYKISGTGWGSGEYGTLDFSTDGTSGALQGGFNAGTYNNCTMDFDYGIIKNSGSTSKGIWGSNLTGKSSQIFSFNHVLFKNTSTFSLNSMPNDTIIEFNYCDFRDPIQTSTAGFIQVTESSDNATGTRKFTNNTAYSSSVKAITWQLRSSEIHDNYTYNVTYLMNPSAKILGYNIYNMFVSVDDTANNNSGVITSTPLNGFTIYDSVFLTYYANPHTIAITGTSVSGNPQKVHHCIFDANNYVIDGGGDTGDILADVGEVAYNNILIGGTGGLLSSGGAGQGTYYAYNNTIIGDYSNLIQVGETSTRTDQLLDFRNNFIGWNAGLAFPTYAGIAQSNNFVAQVTYNIDFNASYENGYVDNLDYPVGHPYIASGTNTYLGKKLKGEWFNPTVAWGTTEDTGLHDQYGDPRFMGIAGKPTMNVVKSVTGIEGTVQSAAREIVKQNGWTYDSQYSSSGTQKTIGTVLNTIRMAYSPTKLFMTLGDSSVPYGASYIGAVQPNTLKISGGTISGANILR